MFHYNEILQVTVSESMFFSQAIISAQEGININYHTKQ